MFGVLTVTFDSWRDALFLGILVSNIVIGCFQEVRSKRALDRLAALVAPEAVVVRDGTDHTVPLGDVVVGDLVKLTAGDQVVADGTVVSADGLTLDEANLTGESEPVVRGPGQPVWSGSFAVEGEALFEATAVGPDSRADKLTATARAFRHPRSPLERGTDRLLLWLVVVSIPLAVGLLISVLLRDHGAAERVQALTAGLVNLVPEGLILLISLTAAVSAFKIAQRGVLAQQLNAVESLASVDVVLTDKTGTLTEPTLRVVGLVAANGADEADAGAGVRRLRRQRAVAQPDPGGDQRGGAGRRDAAPRCTPRCRSPRAGGGAAWTSATSAWCWVRPSASRAPTPTSTPRRARRPPRGAACSRSAAPTRRCPSPRPMRRSPTACGRSGWSSWPSGCAPTPPTP